MTAVQAPLWAPEPDTPAPVVPLRTSPATQARRTPKPSPDVPNHLGEPGGDRTLCGILKHRPEALPLVGARWFPFHVRGHGLARW